MADLLKRIIAANRAGHPVAIPSACTAHPQVLEACLLLTERLDRTLVVEATSNQVNQDGGYTGMRPADFIGFVEAIADRAGVARHRILFGGDHLGPQAWRTLKAEAAMQKAHRMVADYAAAGFTKIHLDCSEGCAGEPAQLDDAETARRSAALAATALSAAPDPARLVFVIGTEVPPPGGARTDAHGTIAPTTPAAARATLEANRDAFRAAGLERALAQVGGLVVQPGVEFTPMQVYRLPPERDPGLLKTLDDWPGMCLEAHSTDYQSPETYRRLAALGFAFQKVGPALTFAWREALYALDAIRTQCGWNRGQSLADEMEALMLAEPRHWQGHYRGESAEQRVERHFGLADRIRYYWPHAMARNGVDRLFHDLAGKILPDPLLGAYFRESEIEWARTAKRPLPLALAQARVMTSLSPYFFGEGDPG